MIFAREALHALAQHDARVAVESAARPHVVNTALAMMLV